MSTNIRVADIDLGNIEERVNRLRAYKGHLNYTFKDIAEKSGVPESTVKKVLTGATKTPRRKTVERMEQALGIREAIECSIAANGKLQDKAPKYISGTAAEKLPDMVSEVELAVKEQMEKSGQSDSGKAQHLYTLEDYYNLPDDRRVELIDGVFYDMAAPTSNHQFICVEILVQIHNFIKKKKGKCVPFVSPIDVRLDEDDYTMLEPDLLIVCDPKKITKKCIFGAPDFVCEVLSPSNIYKDRLRKQVKYLDAGVREYWEVDPEKESVTVYHFEDEGSTPEFYSFTDKVPVHIYGGKLKIDFREIAEQIKTFA